MNRTPQGQDGIRSGDAPMHARLFGLFNKICGDHLSSFKFALFPGGITLGGGGDGSP